jgi:Copper type II ascorbate-dependent monooxygenase, C-terminal domain
VASVGFGGVSRWLSLGALGAVALLSGSCGLASAACTSSASSTITLQAADAYSPTAPTLGATDDYHCTLVDPHVTTDSMITASQFFPNSPEVHHAILFLVPPALALTARLADGNGQGWTCFGETPLPNSSLAQLGETPWLAAWAPGHGKDVAPAGTGMPLPKGSLVIMQIHYNMLVGTAPVRSKLVLTTVPASADLKPLNLDLLPAPPDLPCPAGVTGPLCDRAASLADLGARFGTGQERFVNLLETICGRDPQNPPTGDSTSCTWPIGFQGHVVRLTAHMHLLGRGMKVVLNPGTANAKTLLDVTDYNFDYQRSYDIAPVAVWPGDRLQVTCTYDPTLRAELPQTRALPPRFVTWGDGSSDEMCLAIVAYVH